MKIQANFFLQCFGPPAPLLVPSPSLPQLTREVGMTTPLPLGSLLSGSKPVMDGWSALGAWRLSKCFSVDIRKQMVQRVHVRHNYEQKFTLK